MIADLWHLNRRRALVLVASASTLGFRSCAEQRDDLAVLIETLGHAVAHLVEIAGNSTLSARIIEHTNYAVSLLRAWRPGMPPGDILRALNRIIDDLNLFGDRFRPLVTFALGTIAAIIDQVGRGQGEPAHTRIRLTEPPKNAAAFKRDWDAIRRGSPELEQAPVL